MQLRRLERMAQLRRKVVVRGDDVYGAALPQPLASEDADADIMEDACDTRIASWYEVERGGNGPASIPGEDAAGYAEDEASCAMRCIDSGSRTRDTTPCAMRSNRASGEVKSPSRIFLPLGRCRQDNDGAARARSSTMNSHQLRVIRSCSA